ncbi:hypothetical protein VDGE_06684 [Verticillium dahliae]|uniref:rRNA methyltransferase 2, mitochondrial n=1 Tax=Verticillium dahliae TaxID=27337 RepID=A0A444RVT9_VERDA|nr:hypothetical protein VDGE_06684 [Verticillium dahliae]
MFTYATLSKHTKIITYPTTSYAYVTGAMPVNTRLLDAEQRQQRIHEHTMAHQSQLHQSELVVNDEKTRRLRVRKQLLADDNDALKQRLKVCGSQITQLSGQLEQAQSEVKAAKQAYRQLKKALDTQAREASHLKMELESLNNAAQDSTKVLAEKLALSREIAQLKPELEHLRSQLAHQQTVLAEKLSLERQLNSAEVELAAERRARLQSAEKHELERADGDETKQKLKYFETRLAVETRESERLRQELASAQDDSRSQEERTAADAELQAKVKELEKLLATEKNEAKRAKKEAEVALSELQAQNENLESRVDSLKTKLRSTQSELKGSKAELEAMREAHATNLKGASRAPGPDHHATKKRRAVDLGAEDITTEATNDGDWKSRRPAKKRGLDQTLLGEKSTFSITPFLNRTKGVNVDASVDEDAEEDEADVSHIPHAETVRRAEAEAVDAVKDVERALVSAISGAEGKQGKARGRPKKALASTSPNIPPRAVARPDKMKKAARNVAVLTQVTEESTEVEAPAAGTVSAAHDVSDPSLDASVENGAVKPAVRVLEKKKKRKLIGDSSKTIFDEEDAEPLDSKYRIFKKDQVVVDLGYAPGSWSQVAVERTKPSGSVLGIDLIPAQPPRGVSTIQGDFLSPAVQGMVKDFLVRAQRRRRPDKKPTVSAAQPGDQSHGEVESLGDEPALNTVVEDKPSYIDLERAETADPTTAEEASKSLKLVNVVLSDMSAPWDQTSGFGVNTLSNPYNRMMNTSGVTFKDHVGSMDLCYAALQFASDTLKPGGHFVCKFYQGAEDKELEKQLRKLFAKVFRDKPESSRKDSKEGYFVGLNRKATVHLGDSSDEPST